MSFFTDELAAAYFLLIHTAATLSSAFFQGLKYRATSGPLHASSGSPSLASTIAFMLFSPNAPERLHCVFDELLRVFTSTLMSK